MRSAEKAVLVASAFFFGLGIYLGMFISEANAITDCEQRRVLTITGAFWKPGIKFTCVRGEADRPAAQGAGGLS